MRRMARSLAARLEFEGLCCLGQCKNPIVYSAWAIFATWPELAN